MNITSFLQLNIVIISDSIVDRDIKDTLEKETENDDLIVSVNIVKAAPLNVFVQDKLIHVCNDAVLEDIKE